MKKLQEHWAAGGLRAQSSLVLVWERPITYMEAIMAIMKSIEVMSESTKSFEDAIQVAVNRTAKTVKDIQSANIKNMKTTIKDGKIDKYRVNVKITFKVGD
jgi:flavin-binding protein dodecin